MPGRTKLGLDIRTEIKAFKAIVFKPVKLTIYKISTGNKKTALFKVCDYGSDINHILHIYSSPKGNWIVE